MIGVGGMVDARQWKRRQRNYLEKGKIVTETHVTRRGGKGTWDPRHSHDHTLFIPFHVAVG
ncbi:hypothetical protein SODALDRAFT_329467 [Sodiomyces alkalinus F11]|uniref:Uncharacterized protein n=1 Tax=Sodiomyces alkalinus (strain CBS 110278 / VKM F-3762 / F11) TaxID=1314773 RepID=A0A3N2PJT9_SODAK|nr:hypothetical protein SODALDRAFT_329467 [Sodiomyces alkalinus F11]ROT34783.1 hypothetical protein SODALDRAFT_329467 [Sodiomyces alkalinus F11]